MMINSLRILANINVIPTGNVSLRQQKGVI